MPSNLEPQTIYIFGDSIVYGQWDVGGGWAEKIRQKFVKQWIDNEQFGNKCFVLGVPGETSSELLLRLENEMTGTGRYNPMAKKIAIFASGINDTKIVNGSFKVERIKFTQNCLDFLNICQKYAVTPIFCNLLPVDFTTANKRGKTPLAENENQFRNQILHEICQKKQVELLDFYSVFEGGDLSKILFDGLHPNEQGHNLIAEFVWKTYPIKV